MRTGTKKYTPANPLKVSIFISGRGSNMLRILEAVEEGELPRVSVTSVVSDNPKAKGIDDLRHRSIPIYLFHPGDKKHTLPEAEEKRISCILQKENVDLICLAGFMRILKHSLLEDFKERIINIHPSLLPRHPGLCPQAAALEKGDVESGCTIHLVDEGIDTGAILSQRKVVIYPDDDVDGLSRRILKEEHELYVETLEKISTNQVRIDQ